MPPFRRLTLEDRDLFLKHLGNYPYGTYEYSFTTLYLWRGFCHVQHAIIDDALVVKKTECKPGAFFMPPIGYSLEKLPRIIKEIERVRSETGEMQYLFRDAEAPFVEDMKLLYGDRLIYTEDVDNFDYIYESRDLIDLSGKRYHAKKNHVNQFIKSYSYTLKDIQEQGVVQDCLEFAREWQSQRGESTPQLKAELSGTQDVLGNVEYLGLKGMAVYVDQKIAGFTIGEIVNRDMAIIHIEKADIEYNGIYAFINKTFAEKYLASVRYINREEDLGIEGLRKAKASYHPVRLEKKYLIKLA